MRGTVVADRAVWFEQALKCVTKDAEFPSHDAWRTCSSRGESQDIAKGWLSTVSGVGEAVLPLSVIDSFGSMESHSCDHDEREPWNLIGSEHQHSQAD